MAAKSKKQCLMNDQDIIPVFQYPNAARIGLIADTHGPDRADVLHASIFEIFKGVDLILHGGDITTYVVLEQLNTLAPTIAVRGNNRRDRMFDPPLPEKCIVQVSNDIQIAMWHGMETLWHRITDALFIIMISIPHTLMGMSPIDIVVDLQADTLGTITPSLLGANNPMPSMVERTGFDINTGEFPETFVQAVKNTGTKSLRFPGGNTSGSYFWQNSVGPVQDRPPGFNGSTGQPDPEYYHFGFLEFMQFLQTIGASDPIICINFGLASAAEASAFVEFANGEPGTDPNGTKLASGIYLIRLTANGCEKRHKCLILK